MFKFITDYFQRKREAKALELKKEADHILKVKEDIARILKKCDETGQLRYRSELKRQKEQDSKCPNCKSENVNERIKRLQGSLDGSMSGSSWQALTFGRGHVSGSIHGELDTNGVNKCNDCGHEWKKYVIDYDMTNESSCLRHELNIICSALRYNDKLKNCTFDPLDLGEKFKTLEEKQASLKSDNWAEKHVNPFWGGTLLETVQYFMNDKDKDEFGEYYDYSYLISLGIVDEQ